MGLLGAEVQPVEMAKRLARAMENERAIGVGRSIAPNDYTIHLNPDDFQRFAPIQRSLERELEDYLRQSAQERQLGFLTRPTVRLQPSDSVSRHQIRVSARLADRPSSPTAEDPLEHTQRLQAVSAEPARLAAEPAATPRIADHQLIARADGGRYPLAKPVITLGRALDNDVVLEDTRVSRYHAELRLRNGRFHLRDLRSTNGSFVNGRPTSEAGLSPGDVVSLGGLELVFEVATELRPRGDA